MAPGKRIFSMTLAEGVALRHQRHQRHQHHQRHPQYAPRRMANVGVEAHTVDPPAACLAAHVR